MLVLKHFHVQVKYERFIMLSTFLLHCVGVIILFSLFYISIYFLSYKYDKAVELHHSMSASNTILETV